jgi:hypothetical protein
MINIEGNKARFIAQLSTVKREGIDRLIKWLEESDFFTAPASTKFHLSEPGGLCQHSLHVDMLLFQKCCQFFNATINWPFPEDSVNLIGKLHDVCKANFYAIGSDYPISDAMIYSLEKDSSNLVRTSQENRDRFRSYCIDPETRKVKADINKDVASKLISWLKAGCPDPMPETPITYKVVDQFPAGHGAKSVIILQKFIELTDEETFAILYHMGAFELSEYNLKAYNLAKKLPLVTLLQTADQEASAILEAENDPESV